MPTTPTSPHQWHLRIWQMTWPVILANITIPLVGVADVWVMGRLPDPKYIAAVAMGAAMFSAVYWLFGFLRMATTGLVAQALGRGDMQATVAIFIRALAIALILGCAIFLARNPLQWMLFGLFDSGETVTALANDYYSIRVFGAPGLLIYLVALGMLFGLQRMRDTLWLSIGLNLTNFALDMWLVIGFDLGVSGVALGTVISEWAAAILGFWLVLRALRQSGWSGQWPLNIWRRREMRELFHISSNLVLRTFFVQLPFFVGTVLASGINDMTLAAHGVLMQLFFIMTFSLDGFAHTAETLTGYYYGAKQSRHLRTAVRYCAIWGMILAAIMGLSYFLGGQQIIDLLTTSTAVRQTAGAYLPWVALAPLLCMWAFLFDGIFIGTTHIVEMRNSMIIAALLWALGLWLTFDSWGYHGVWFAMSMFMLTRSVLMAIYYPTILRNATSQ